MNVKYVFCKLINKLSALYARRSSDLYCKYLKNKGIQIGGGRTYIQEMH